MTTNNKRFTGPMLFLNIGWMMHYKGLPADRSDTISGGGQFVTKNNFGGEILNFSPFNGRFYGYVQPAGWNPTIHIERIGADRKAEILEGVSVVWTARRPRYGAVVVGFYENARVYRQIQSAPPGSNRFFQHKPIGWFATAKARDCRVLPLDYRILKVPRRESGGMGQSNVWYATYGVGMLFKDETREWLRKLDNTHKHAVGGTIYQADPAKRRAIEEQAVRTAWGFYRRAGYSLKRVDREKKGWDLEATRDGVALQIEVKGRSESDVACELTPREYEQMNMRKETYRVAVVTRALMSHPRLAVFAFNAIGRTWETEDGRRLKVYPRTGARLTSDG